MGVTYNEIDDTLYVRTDEAPIIGSEEIQPGLIVDCNESGQVIGIEMHGLNDSGMTRNRRSGGQRLSPRPVATEWEPPGVCPWDSSQSSRDGP